jgi:hypothetical protein
MRGALHHSALKHVFRLRWRMSPDEWKVFLDRLSRDVLADDDTAADLPPDVVASGWLGFAPATEHDIAEAESRLGGRFPPSLRSFYAVTNGWRVVGCFIWNILSVQELGWLQECEPHLYELAEMAESTPGPFKDDPGEARLNQYRHEQGTRVKRSLVVNSEGDDSTWLLDPETRTADGEWAGGRWSGWNPAMSWYAASFSELMKEEHSTFLKLRS